MSTIGEINEFPRKLDIEWKIKNFFSSLNEDKFYFSPSFSFDDETWCILMYPNGNGDNDSIGYIDLFLFRDSFGPPVNPEFHFALKSANGKKYQGSHHTDVFTNEHCKSGVFKFISKSELLERKSELVPDDIITIVCTMRSTEDTRYEKLSDDLKEMMLDGKHSDVTISVKGEEFRLHKNILGARNSFFNSMFKSNMKENITGVVSIDDCKLDVLRSFIHFVYTGKVDNLSLENVCDLYKVADKYQENQLKEDSLQFMMKNVCVDTFCDFVVLALQHDEEKLLKRASEFFFVNVKEIIRCAKWQTFLREYPTQANELYIEALDYLTE